MRERSPDTLTGRNKGRERLVKCVMVSGLVAAALQISGCDSNNETCRPSALTASPNKVEAGGNVQLTSGPATCDLGLPANPSYKLHLIGRHADRVLALGSYSVASDGTFRADVPIPSGAAPGVSEIVATAPGQKFCTGQADCSAYAVTIFVKGQS